MNPFLHLTWCEYRAGESFLPEARRRIQEYGNVIELIPRDLLDYSWDNGPIKILLVDAMKNQRLAQAITLSFYPSLVEGSILIHQDFKHYYTPCIHILQYRLRDHFQLKEEVHLAGTLAFETVRRVSPDAASRAAQVANASESEVADAFAYSASLCSDSYGKSAVAAAHVMHFIHNQDWQKAREIFDRYSKGEVQLTNDMEIVRNLLEQAKG